MFPQAALSGLFAFGLTRSSLDPALFHVNSDRLSDPLVSSKGYSTDLRNKYLNVAMQ